MGWRGLIRLGTTFSKNFLHINETISKRIAMQPRTMVEKVEIPKSPNDHLFFGRKNVFLFHRMGDNSENDDNKTRVIVLC